MHHLSRPKGSAFARRPAGIPPAQIPPPHAGRGVAGRDIIVPAP